MNNSNGFWSLLRDAFAMLNILIYSFIEIIYGFLIQLSDVRVFSTETLGAFSTRIYAILGIFMAFKLTFTFISYAVNPDTLTNESKGGKKLVINIITALVLLIAVPNLIFPLSRELQSTILKDNILEQVILGTDPNVGNQAIDTKRAGRYLSFSVLNGFFYPDENLKSTKEGDSNGKSCADSSLILDDTAPGEGGPQQDPSGQQGLENALYKLNGDCAQAILDMTEEGAGDMVFWYETAYSQKSVSMLMGGLDNSNLKRAVTKDGYYVFYFNYIVSLIVGCGVIALLINFCFKIAVRTIKLGFLELIAPIPILSYIDENTKKKTFDSWVKECAKTYIDLFIRLAALYFAIFLITQVVTSPTGLTYSDGSPADGIVTVVIIIGALMFASEIPKLIGNILGVKLDGDGKFSLNPFKGSPLAAGVVGGVMGAGAGFAANAHNLGRNLHKSGWTGGETGIDGAKNVARNIFTLPGGMIGGAARSYQAGSKDKEGNVFKAVKGGVTTSSNNRELRASGYSMTDKARDTWTDMAGIKNEAGTTSVMKGRVKQYQQQVADSKEREEKIRRAQAASAQRVSSTVDLGETTRVNKYKTIETDDGKGNKKFTREYQYDPSSMYNLDENKNIISKNREGADALYDRYVADASGLGLETDQYLNKNEFFEQMNLEMQSWAQDDETKRLEKSLKETQEEMERAHPAKK